MTSEIDGEYVDEYKDSPDYHTITYFASFYMVNEKEEIFQNLNIRKAIQIGYDRDALVQPDPQERHAAGARDTCPTG